MKVYIYEEEKRAENVTWEEKKIFSSFTKAKNLLIKKYKEAKEDESNYNFEIFDYDFANGLECRWEHESLDKKNDGNDNKCHSSNHTVIDYNNFTDVNISIEEYELIE